MIRSHLWRLAAAMMASATRSGQVGQDDGVSTARSDSSEPSVASRIRWYVGDVKRRAECACPRLRSAAWA